MKASLKITADSVAHECLDELSIPYRKNGSVISVTIKDESFEKFNRLLSEKMQQTEGKECNQ